MNGHAIYLTRYVIRFQRQYRLWRAAVRLKKGFEILPLVEPFPVDRLADLLGTRGADRTLGLVELHAGGLEFEHAAEIKETAHIAFEVVHHLLVHDAQHPSGKHLVPMAPSVQDRYGSSGR